MPKSKKEENEKRGIARFFSIRDKFFSQLGPFPLYPSASSYHNAIFDL